MAGCNKDESFNDDPKMVAQAIRDAFKDTPRPGSRFEEISATLDDEGIVEYFANKPWWGHKVADLRWHNVALSFFTDAAFRYFLPAFMLAELESPVEADTILDAIVFAFTGSYCADERVACLSKGERRAVALFMEWCGSRYELCAEDCRLAVRSLRRGDVPGQEQDEDGGPGKQIVD